MRLHRLALTNVKAVAHREVVFPDRGVVILAGANEVGKTSMIEALDLLIDYKDTSKDRRVLAMRPVGSDTASAVEVEMTAGPYRFTYRKQWFKQAATTLTITQPRHEHLVGAAAHERVLSLLAETTDLDLWKALRLLQASPLASAELSGSSALAAALDEAAGRCQRNDGEGQALVHTVEGLVTSFYTARAGTETGAYRLAREQREHARAAYEAARAAVDQISIDVQRHEVVGAELANHEALLATSAADCAELAERWAGVAAAVEAVEQAARESDLAQREVALARSRHDQRMQLRDRRAQRQEQVAQLEAGGAALTAAIQPQLAREADLSQAVARTQSEQQALDEAYGHAQRWIDQRRDRAELARVEAVVARLAQLRDALAKARHERDAAPLDQAQLAAIQAAAQELELARAAEQAVSACVRISGMSGRRSIEVAGESLRPAKGSTVIRAVTEPLEIVVAGVLTMTIEPGQGATAMAERVAEAQRRLTQLLSDADVPDVAEAAAAHERWARAGRELAHCEQTRRELLAGQREADLQAQIAQLQEALDRDEAGEDRQLGSLADALALRDELRQQRDELQQRYRRLSTELAQVRAELADQRTQVERARTLAQALREQAEHDEAGLAQARAEAPDDLLAHALTQAQARLGVAQEVEQVARGALASLDPERIQLELEQTRTHLAQCERSRQELRDERVAIEARLEQAGREGRQEALDAATAEFAAAERDFLAIDRRAKATRLLHDTLQRRRNEAKQAYVEPFRQAVTRLGQGVYGSSFGVEVNSALAVEARVLHGKRIGFDALSTGAQEQLAILTRLACASLVDGEAGVPVVLDDALGYSDPDRLQAVGEAFGQLGQDTQVVLLTCTPGRYTAIPNATVIQLS